MSLLLALDSAIQETEEFKRNASAGIAETLGNISLAPAEQPKASIAAMNPVSSAAVITSSSSTTTEKGHAERDASKERIKCDASDLAAIEILGVPKSQSKIVEKLPPLPTQNPDPAVTSAMIKLSTMLAAPEANPVR